MNTSPDDEALRRLLRENLAVATRRDPGFRAAVWARIEAGRRAPATWAAWLRVNVVRVSLIAALSIVASGVGGGWLATAQAGRNREKLVERYVASIDPLRHVAAESRP